MYVLKFFLSLSRCVWAGDQSGSVREETESEAAAEMSVQTREHISILMEQ